MCVMITEIQIIEGGQKRCLLTRGDQIKKNVFLMSDATSNECIAGNGQIPEKSVIQVSTEKNDIKVQYLYVNYLYFEINKY